MAPMQSSLGPPRDEPRVFGLDKFNGDNFAEWSFEMENIFDHYDLLEVMEGTEKRPENDPEKSPWVRKSAQGYLLLGQALGSSQIRHIKPFQREPEKGPKAWAALKGVHAPATAAVEVVLERQMAALRIEEDEAVEEGVQKFFDLLTRLEGADLNYSELQKNTKLLALLPESWSSLIINLNRDLPRLSLEDVKRSILQEDFRRLEAAGVADTAATTRATDAVVADSTASATIVTRADTCGAIATNSLMDGLLLKDKRVEEQEEGEEEAVEAVAVAEVVLQRRMKALRSQQLWGKVTLHSLDYWVIDSGATYSMTPRVDLLTELEPSPVKHVTSTLGQRAEVKGMGKAMFKGADGKMVGLKNVLWVPNLAANLISVRRLQKAGMDTSSKGAKTYTTRLGERIIWDLHEDRDVYNEMWQIPVVPMPKERQVAASISTKGEAVGSGDGANGRAKEIKSKKSNLGGTSKLSEHEECGAAAKKQHKDEENPMAAAEEYGENMWGTIASAAFSNPTSAKAPLDEVVMDVVGPLKLGAAGAEYFLTIVDVYTRMTWVYVLSKKSDVAETVKTDWLPMVERQQDRLVKAIRTDRGGVFLSKKFSFEVLEEWECGETDNPTTRFIELLKKEFLGQTKARVEEFREFRQGRDESLLAYYCKLRELAEDLESSDERLLVRKFVRGLEEDLRNMVRNTVYGVGADITLKEVYGLAKRTEHAQRMLELEDGETRPKAKSSWAAAALVETAQGGAPRTDGRRCHECGELGHLKRDWLKLPVCGNCGKRGHKEDAYYSRRRLEENPSKEELQAEIKKLQLKLEAKPRVEPKARAMLAYEEIAEDEEGESEYLTASGFMALPRERGEIDLRPRGSVRADRGKGEPDRRGAARRPGDRRHWRSQCVDRTGPSEAAEAGPAGEIGTEGDPAHDR
ncbi:unnamed protein product [Closterium sp. NIES-53]